MLKLSLFWIISCFFAFSLEAKLILGDLDFNPNHEWVLVGVTLYNYKSHPIQNEIGSFEIKDLNVLNSIKRDWNVSPFYEDHCEYHYAIKIYKDKKLIKTLKINLYCNYITEGVFSYSFNPEWLFKLRPHLKPISWSKIVFKNLPSLRNALDKLNQAPNVYLYQDVTPYKYDGYFVIRTPEYNWNINRDSVLSSLKAQLLGDFQSNAFHVAPYVFFLSKEYKISFRILVYCQEELFKKYRQPALIEADWRSHFEFLAPEEQNIELIILGVDKKRYMEIVFEE